MHYGLHLLCLYESFHFKTQDVTHGNTPLEMRHLSNATLMQQAEEWGVCAIQRSFPHLKDCMHYEENGQ
jgi:hypothetical protein